ncbi:unnamed protein product [Dicrocoelium dendriticum]|nr:unnamed protein product [Dicrocoelium dendriticum]
MRRYENEAFLNTLSVVAEADEEEEWSVDLPDSLYHNSLFAKLFEDDSIRAVWDMFINLSETEQARVLHSLCHNHLYEPDACPEFTTDLDIFSDEDVIVVSKQPVGTRTPHRARRSKRGHRKPKAHVPPTTLKGDNSSDAEVHSTNTSGSSRVTIPHEENTAILLRDPIPKRFFSLVSGTVNSNRFSCKFPGRRKKQMITTLDFCLIGRVESELRHWFGCHTDSVENEMSPWPPRRAQKRWTPTISILGHIDFCSWVLEHHKFPVPILLDSLERLLVHSVANYLGLYSYSKWSNLLNTRQLWIEQKPGLEFRPPQLTLINLLRSHLARRS